MNDARNAVLKEASNLSVTTSISINLNIGVGGFDALLEGPRPPGATGTFIGEGGTGGSGWFVTQPDGSQGKFYTRLVPNSGVNLATRLPDLPASFLGKSLSETTVVGVSRLYVGWLKHLVDDAAQRFG